MYMLKKIQFWLALWGGKVFLWWYKRTGHVRNDRPGMVSMRLCSDFLKYVAKPKLTIAVSGTNGKTTVSHIVASVLTQQGKTVSYNDWGANHHAGHARCILDAVDFLNRPTKDAVVIEMDELISPINVPKLKPNYLIVTNLARDSMERNANPEYIGQQLKKAAEDSPGTVVILNADDPLSCFIGQNNRRLYFGVCDQHSHSRPALADDFTVCPNCGTKPDYHYRNYRHIGDFSCPCCGLKSPARDYFVAGTQDGMLTMQEPGGTFRYPIISSAVHNLYNLAAVITLFRDMGLPHEVLAKDLANATLPVSRESRMTVGGIELITQVAKGQNPTAVSTVFENVAKDPSEKELILILDDLFDDPHKTETVAWIYDSDYEYLNDPHIRKIVVGGERYLDHRLRLLLAGVPEEKLVCMRDMFETANFVDTQGIDRIYVLHDVNSITRGRKIRDAVKARIEQEGGVSAT